MFNSIKKNGLLVAVAGTGTALMSTASHAIDTAAVGTAITAAETDALATGELVIASVAALVVVGLVIAMIRKL